MQIFTRLVLLLPAADLELVVLARPLDLCLQESRHSQRDPQPLWLAALSGDPLDVVRRITVRPGLRNLVERPLEVVEAEQQRRGQRRHTHHFRSPLSGASRTSGTFIEKHPVRLSLQLRTAKNWSG